MSNVSAALSTALSSPPWSQTKLAQLSGIDRGMLNRYVRGTAPLGAENLVALLKVLSPPHNSALLAGYLRDAIPSGSEALVAILTNATISETPPTLPEDLDPKLRDAIMFLARKAMVHTEIRDMLMHFAKVLRGRPH